MALFLLKKIKPKIICHSRLAGLSLRRYSDTRPLCSGPIEVPDDTELVRDLSVMDSRSFAYTETDQNQIKPPSAQVLTFSELFDEHNSSYYKHRKMYQQKVFQNFQEISYFDMMHFGYCSFFIRAEYRPLNNVNGESLRQYAKSRRESRDNNIVQKIATAGTGCFVTRNDRIDIDVPSCFMYSAAHNVAKYCDSKMEKIHDSNNKDIAGELVDISILTRGPNQRYIGYGIIEYLDPDHDIAILRCSQSNPCSMRVADFDINNDTEMVTEIMNAGYHCELETVDSNGTVIDDKRVIDVFGEIGELSFCSLNQKYVDKNVDIKENQLKYSKTKKIVNAKKGGKLEIYSPILKARSGGGVCIKPREIIGIVIEENLAAKYNNVAVITNQAKERLEQLEM